MRLESSVGFRFIVRPGSGLTVSKSWSCHYSNSYLFVRCTDPELRNLTTGVWEWPYCPITMENRRCRQKEIDAIQEFLDQASEHVLCPGEEVEILCGAMKHVSGKVKKIKKNHLVLYLEQLGATVCVKLDDVARVDRLK
mgnify:CR=1 FL=1